MQTTPEEEVLIQKMKSKKRTKEKYVKEVSDILLNLSEPIEVRRPTHHLNISSHLGHPNPVL